jgi:hypothetical protein
MASTCEQNLVCTTKDFLTYLNDNSPADVLTLNQHMIYEKETKYVSVKIDPEEYPDGIELIHFTDLQFGHVTCNKKRISEFVAWILDKPNRFVLFGGDMVDAATQFSIANPYENEWRPSGQCWRLAEVLLPMRHRVLGYVGGNHERRTDKTFGSLGLFIAMLLRVPYSEGQQFIDIHYGDWAPFKVHMWHGAGSAKTKGAKAQMMDRYMAQGDSHVYLVGHLHDALLLWGWRQERYRNRIRLVKKACAMSSSFLDFWGTYAEVAGLSASDTMMARVIVEPSGHFEVTMR